MTTRSAKAKGRRAQNEVAQSLRETIYLPHGCHEDDVKPVTMGLSGMDIILTPAARRVFDLINETKNVEKLNVITTFNEHYAKYAAHSGLKILTHRKNKTPMLATLLWSDLLAILGEVVNARVTGSAVRQNAGISAEKGLPDVHSIYSEQVVLGSVMCGYTTFEEISILGYAAFSLHKHRVIYRAMEDMAKHKIEITLTAISQYCIDNDLLIKIDGMTYLSELHCVAPGRTAIDYHIDLIDRRSRATVFVSDVMLEVASIINRDKEYEVAKDDIIRHCQVNSSHNSGEGLLQTPGEIVAQVGFDKFFGVQLPGIQTGITRLDADTYGFHPGELIIIGARPSDGKTALLTQIASFSALESHNTHIISLEMSKEQLLQRAVCQRAGVSYHHIRTGAIGHEERFKLQDAMSALECAPLYIDDRVDWTLVSIKQHLKFHVNKGTPISLLGIDYLQLMPIAQASKQGRRDLELGEVTRSLKLMAKEFHTSIVLLSQLRRNSENENRKPTKADLRDSGNIEADADVIILLWHDKTKDKQGEAFRTSELLLEKQRNGPVGPIPVWFHREAAVFLDR